MDKKKTKIVILGGGFGGLYTYKSLCKQFSPSEVDITIVNKTNYFLFTPLLHEVATGSIAHHQVVESIRQIIYKNNTTLHVAEVLSVDLDKKIVKTSIDELSFDIIVVALGATTNFFNSPGAEENSLVLKDLHDALRIRTLLIDTFEKASEIANVDERKMELSFAIVGGGATGVELVTEIIGLFTDTFSKYYRNTIDPSDISLYLINRDPEILMPFHPSLRQIALDVLQKEGIKVLLNTGVKEIKKDSIIFVDDKSLPVRHVIWTAGVKPNPPMFNHEVVLDRSGRIVVNSALQIPDHPDVFVIGDMASLSLNNDGRPLPMLAQIAVLQGEHTGINIKRLVDNKVLLPFSYKSKGELVSLGQHHAVANIYGFKFSGFIAWFIWRTVYLFKFLSFSKKFKIAMDWTMNIFFPRDITKE